MIPFKPVIEPNLPEAFLTEHPKDIIQAGNVANVPWMNGLNKDEGALRVAGEFFFFLRIDPPTQRIRDDFQFFTQHIEDVSRVYPTKNVSLSMYSFEIKLNTVTRYLTKMVLKCYVLCPGSCVKSNTVTLILCLHVFMISFCNFSPFWECSSPG